MHNYVCVYIYFNRLNYYKNFHPLLELNVEINRGGWKVTNLSAFFEERRLIRTEFSAKLGGENTQRRELHILI